MRFDHPPGFTGPATPTERKRKKHSPVVSASLREKQSIFIFSSHLSSHLHLLRLSTRVITRYRLVPRSCETASSSNHKLKLVIPGHQTAPARISRFRDGIRKRRSQLRNFATAFRASRDAVHALTTLALVTSSESERPNARRSFTHDYVVERECDDEHRQFRDRYQYENRVDTEPARKQHQDQDWSLVQGRHLDQNREQDDRDEVVLFQSAGLLSLSRHRKRTNGRRTRGGKRTRGSQANQTESLSSFEVEASSNNNSTDYLKTPSAPATSVPSVDVLAYTAYNDDSNEYSIERNHTSRQGNSIPYEYPRKDSDRRQPVADENANPIKDTTSFRSKLLHIEQKRTVREEQRSVERGDKLSFVAQVDSINRGVFRESNHDFWPPADEDKQSTEEHGRAQRGKRTDNTARSQEPITEARTGIEEEEKEEGRSVGTSDDRRSTIKIKGPTRKLRPRGRKYGLLFILYLLVWPLLCSTNPSGQFATAFAQRPSLSHTDSLAQRNATLAQYSSFLSSTVVHQQHHQPQQQALDHPSENDPNGHHHNWHDQQWKEQPQQQQPHKQHSKSEELLEKEVQREQEQESKQDQDHEGSGEGHQSVIRSESVHPYNEYTWEVNQINPWLSACDLAGPAPADLQGSCGPPEVPKNCPVACASKSRASQDDLGFLEVIERLEATGRESSTERRKTTRAPQGVNQDSSSSVGTNEKQQEESEAKNRKEGDRGKLDGGVRTAPEQCLFYLEESHKRDVCRVDFGQTSTRSFLTPRENRYWFMSGLRLRHCCEHAVVNALAPGKGGPLEDVLNGGRKCADALDKLLLVDALAARLHCEFEEVLARYDCAQPYSVIHNCTHCKEAYRKWVCSSLVPYFAHGGPEDLESLKGSWTGNRLRPCRSFCQSVEQRCPYLLPGDRAPAYPTQYAGEPTFLCRDPKIPETGEQAGRALHSSEEDECCFHVCSEEEPGSGICANCTDREPRKRGRSRDPPPAPHCEINPIQSLPTGQQYPIIQGLDTEVSTEGNSDEEDSSVSPMPSSSIVHPQQGASLCGSGGVFSMTTTSSSIQASSPTLLVWLSSIFLLFLGRVCWTPNSLLQNPILPPPGSFSSGRIRGNQSQDPPKPSSLGIRGVSGIGALIKWVMIECRCRGWWWCWWWWWRSSRNPSGPHIHRKLAKTGSPVNPVYSMSSFSRLFSWIAERCRDWRRSWWCWWLWYRWRTRRKFALPFPIRNTVLSATHRPHGRRERQWLKRKSKSRMREENARKGNNGLVKGFHRSSAKQQWEYLRLSSRQDPP